MAGKSELNFDSKYAEVLADLTWTEFSVAVSLALPTFIFLNPRATNLALRVAAWPLISVAFKIWILMSFSISAMVGFGVAVAVGTTVGWEVSSLVPVGLATSPEFLLKIKNFTIFKRLFLVI